MSTRTDHAKEAQEWIMRALNPTDAFERSSAAKVAQVHATLALVEQQRIANLIALGMYTHANGSRGFQHLVCHPTDEYSVALNDDIREGLGI